MEGTPYWRLRKGAVISSSFDEAHLDEIVTELPPVGLLMVRAC